MQLWLYDGTWWFAVSQNPIICHLKSTLGWKVSFNNVTITSAVAARNSSSDSKPLIVGSLYWVCFLLGLICQCLLCVHNKSNYLSFIHALMWNVFFIIIFIIQEYNFTIIIMVFFQILLTCQMKSDFFFLFPSHSL